MNGDHIKFQRKGYTHHGIDLGDGTLIHYSGEPGKSKASAGIRRDKISKIAQGGPVSVRRYGNVPFTAAEIVARAESKLGIAGYNLAWNNCEHFATWCVTDRHSSRQANGAAAGAGVGTAAGAGGAAGLGVVAAAGEVAGLSASGITSGLAGAGSIVGGGAVAGLYVIGIAPGAASAAVMNFALRNDESLPDDERIARRAGRVASVVGGVGGSTAGVAAVTIMGTSGVSAVGISTGLATLGGVVGGGMAAGTAVVAAAPAVAAAAIGYGAYRAVRAFRGRRTSEGPDRRSVIGQVA
ncbi:MAG TPA: lecithin retinol acyltransferase family protein [Dehalococcoidia bacterium]|jgi:hypothetical protein